MFYIITTMPYFLKQNELLFYVFFPQLARFFESNEIKKSEAIYIYIYICASSLRFSIFLKYKMSILCSRKVVEHKMDLLDFWTNQHLWPLSTEQKREKKLKRTKFGVPKFCQMSWKIVSLTFGYLNLYLTKNIWKIIWWSWWKLKNYAYVMLIVWYMFGLFLVTDDDGFAK